MGLFSSKPKRNLLDIIGLTINPTIESQLTQTSKSDGFTDYACEIQENFKLFDKATFRIFGHQKDLSGNSSFNLILESKGQSVTINKIKEMVNSIISGH